MPGSVLTLGSQWSLEALSTGKHNAVKKSENMMTKPKNGRLLKISTYYTKVQTGELCLRYEQLPGGQITQKSNQFKIINTIIQICICIIHNINSGMEFVYLGERQANSQYLYLRSTEQLPYIWHCAKCFLGTISTKSFKQA